MPSIEYPRFATYSKALRTTALYTAHFVSMLREHHRTEKKAEERRGKCTSMLYPVGDMEIIFFLSIN